MHSRYILAAVLAVAAARAEDAPPPAKSVEERVKELEASLGGGPKEMTEEDRKVLQRDFEEICALGLHTRALKEFAARMPGCTVKRWTTGYFRTKDVAWFSFFYLVAGATEEKQIEFGFRKKDGVWELMWPEPPRERNEEG